MKTMTRAEQVSFCKKCLNRKSSYEGLICNLTGEKATFQSECVDFKLDEIVKERPQVKERHGFVTFWLWLMVIVNSIYIITYLGLFTNRGYMLFLTLAFFSLFNTCSSIALLKWKKWGFWGFCISALIVVLININFRNGELVIFGLLGPVLLWAILQIKKGGTSCWNYLG